MNGRTGKILLFAAAAAGLVASALHWYTFVNWIVVPYFLVIVLFALAAGCVTARFAKSRPVLKGLIAAAAYAAGFFGVAFLINNVILGTRNNRLACAIIMAVNLVFFICFYSVLSRKNGGKKLPAAIAFALCACAAAGTAVLFWAIPEFDRAYYKPVTSPVLEGKSAAKEIKMLENADFYVSPDGSDASDGSINAPFATLERARDAVRELDKTGKTGVTVAVRAGEYRVDSIVFGAGDGGTAECPVTYAAYGDGEVVLNGGVTLPYGSFSSVTDEAMRARLSDGAKDKVICADFGKLGITAEQYGRIYAVGGYNQASHYDGDWVGDIYCELFVDDARMTIARYPNGREYLYTGAVVSEGSGRESANAALKAGYDSLRNPEPDVYKMDKELSERIKGWQIPEAGTPNTVWMFGYWRYDWADGSTPLGKVDHDAMTISPMFVSSYGAKKDAPYYFFNVFEELDAPGEWYLDRETGVLYLFPPEGFTENSVIDLSLTTDNIIRVEGAEYLTFDGFTVKGTRGDAISVTGNGNTVKNCLIKNVSGNALTVSGYDNLVTDNEITRTGKGGVILDGGDRETLAPGNNRATNNLVHDWAEIYETYQPAFTLGGVGNRCDHNEMYNSPHEAITWSGNDHMIEYNLIHHVNLLTDDGGAIYSGRRWDWYGTVIRYNLIYDLGADGHKPEGIYLDDALAGITVYGNVLINVPNIGLQLGGGRDLDVHDNIVINSNRPMTYNDRALTGLPGNEGSFHEHYKEGGSVWQLLWDSPWESAVWRERYPQYERYSDDFGNPDDPGFVLNPAYSTVTRNIFTNKNGTIGDISDAAYKFSDISGNAVFKNSQLEEIFVDPENGDYTLRDDAPIDFDIDVPAFSEIGRVY